MLLAHPYYLILLVLVPILVLIAVAAGHRKRKEWAAFVADRLRGRLIQRASALPRWLSFVSLLLAIILLIIGMARLQTNMSKQSENTRGRNLIIALDLSRSMKVADLKPSRLDQSKALIYELLETLPNDRIGVVGFSSSAFLFAPLTIDHSAVRETVEQLDYDSIPTGGSDLAAGVELAVATLKETAQQNNGLLILSDGEEHSPRLMKTMSDIKKSGTYVFAVGVGTDDGGFIPDKDYPDGRFRDINDNVVISRLQAETLREFATQSGGRFALAQSASDIPNMVAAAVSDLESFELKGLEKFLATEQFQWFIMPAILLLMTSILLGTRWRSFQAAATPVVTLLVLCLCLLPARAEEPNLATARDALSSGNFKLAQEEFERLAAKEDPMSDDYAALYLGKATADYRLGDLPAARGSYSKALTTEDSAVRAAAHQGMGNTLFQMGWKSLAKGDMYPGEKEGVEKFDAMVKERMAEWMKDDSTDAKTDSEGYLNMKSVLLNWADAVRHAQSAVSMDPSSVDAKQNETVARQYLEKLRKALEQQQSEMQQQMGGQGDGEGEQPGGEGEGGEEEGDGKGEGEPKDGKGKNGDKESEDEGKGPGKRPEDEKPDPNNTHGADKKSEETKEQHALRKLNENADLQRGIVAPGRHEFRRPEKDW